MGVCFRMEMMPSSFVLSFLLGLVTSQTHPDIMLALRTAGQFSTFISFLERTNIVPFIASSPHFTVFAPTDHAFAKLTPAALQALNNDQAKMADLMAYHVVLNQAFHLRGSQDVTLTSSNHHQIRINTYNIVHTVTANGVNITIRNVLCNHGVLHGLDSVLVIPTANTLQIGINRPDLSVFTNLVVGAGLLPFFTTDHNQTLFIPNNAAFQKLEPRAMQYLESHPADMKETLKFHLVRATTIFTLGMRHSMTLPSVDLHHDALMVLEGTDGSLGINQAKLVERDIIATDGVIHVLDSVLIPTRVVVNINDQGIVLG
ncbi:periostin-like [Biomphalaria glabrata]|uniref:Periostin-like n=1 Tax=Biomphalaria glabrata TaxID=6526 RepID=A0A9U8EAC7_BIOGL|nr:periostin-like [Biomphalaria glabrata]